MDKILEFQQEREERIKENARNRPLQDSAKLFMDETLKARYSYNFSWMGRPIIQYPQDMIAMQEILWRVQPDLVIETGIAHGGSLIFYASILELIGRGEVLGIDIEIRPHNRKAIEEHPMFRRITMLEGSSIGPEIAEQVKAFAEDKKKVLVCLDSNHTHDHVLREMQLYGPLVSVGSYLVVFDTIVEHMAAGSFPDRPWDKGDNPKTAVQEFLRTNDGFTVDTGIDNKLLITVAPGGYLRRVV